jgi:hypothetical protein
MPSRLAQLWVWWALTLLSTGVHAATEIGVVTFVEGDARVLRGASWYKLAPGVRVDDADIVAVADRAQMQVELTTGVIASLSGPGSLYLMPLKAGSPLLWLASGWLKLSAKAPGARLRLSAFDVTVPEGTLVMRSEGAQVEVFVEAGRARLVEVAANGKEGQAREAKRGEFWAKSADGTFSMVPRAPRAFVSAMPRHFTDALPALAARLKGKPALAVDHEITFAEAEPWLATRERAVFERRFAGRLRDPEFRKDVGPNISRYPMWNRMLHPERFAPKPAPPK